MADPKTIASIEILHLDETGYGPEGKHTRRQWREECLTNLLAGKAQFGAWQKSWQTQAQSNKRNAKFGLVVIEADGIRREVDRYTGYGHLSHSLDFSGYEFEQEIDAKNITFDCDVLFVSSLFLGYADFRESTFLGYAKFDQSRFRGYVNFRESKFSGNADFFKSSFSEYAQFGEAIFSGDVDFSESTFPDPTHALLATFPGDADVFLNREHFRDVKIPGNANFFKSTFLGYAKFCKAKFRDVADFSEATFRDVADFSEATFRDVADFSEATFSGDTKFREATFSVDANFRVSQFSGRAYFTKTIFKSSTWFYHAQFSDTANFESAAFANVGHFEEAEFESKVPAFRSCKIDATRLEFSDEKHFSSEDYSEDAIKNISFLKRLADQHGQVDQAIEFNAMELLAKRNNRLELIADKSWMQRFTNGDWWTTRATGVYQYASDFGRSFTIPMKWYGCLMVVTCLLALVSSLFCAPQVCQSNASHNPLVTWSKYNKCDRRATIYLTGYTAATEYTLYRASGFFHFSDKGKQTIEVNRRLFNSPVEPWFMRLWGLFTSFASTVLFFFIGLGLRNNYRIK